MSDTTYKPPIQESDRGKSIGYDQAYIEGYACKYNQWDNRDNPYAESTAEGNGFDDGYLEALIFA